MEALVILTVKTKNLTGKQKQEKHQLQVECFSNISSHEIEKDFYNPEVVSVLAYLGDKQIA